MTEIGINRALYTLLILKRNCLYLLPTNSAASDFSKARIDGALELSSELASAFNSTDAVGIKKSGPSTLYIRGAGSRTNTKSVDVSELICDEADEFSEEAMNLALERLSGQLNKHVYAISTPTVNGYGINALFSGSTQNHFFFKCPSCSKHIELRWPESVVICGESATDTHCEDSYLKCTECGARLPHDAKPDFLRDGVWQPTVKSNPDVQGFYVSQLYSSTITPGELVAKFHAGAGSEQAAQEFHNSKLGLPYIGQGSKVTDDQINDAVRGYSMQDAELRPTRAGPVITLGADQGNIGHVVICQWLPVRDGGKDISESYDCKVLFTAIYKSDELWTRLAELMAEFQVLYAVMDMDPESNAAKSWCKKFCGYAALSRYRNVKAAREVQVTEEDTGAPILTVDRTFVLSRALGRFRTHRITLPRDIPEDFRHQIKCLVRTYSRPKNPQKETPTAMYVRTGDLQDHYAHCLSYAEIALQRVSSTICRNLGKIY